MSRKGDCWDTQFNMSSNVQPNLTPNIMLFLLIAPYYLKSVAVLRVSWVITLIP